MSLLEERVANGVKVLNGKMPGWYVHVSLEKLNMSSCVNCLLAQLYGGYLKGAVLVFDLSDENASGKIASQHGFDTYDNAEYSLLTQAWKKVIFDMQKEMA